MERKDRRGERRRRNGILEWRTEGTPMPWREETGVCFEFRGADEGRERTGFTRRNPGARGTIGAEGGFDLLGVRGKL